MKKIPLTKNQFALVDDEDFEWLNQWKWCAMSNGTERFAAGRNPGRKRPTELMHRKIMGVKGRWPLVDHINGNPLDNRRKNLRICNQSQNMRNRDAPKSNTSGYKGVYLHKQSGLWHARITLNYKNTSLGYYRTAVEAAVAYNEGAIKYHKDFAKLNEGPELNGVVAKRIVAHSSNTSGYRGVHQRKDRKGSPVWRAIFRSKSLGQFATPEEAARAYDAKAKEMYGEKAKLNFPEKT